MEQAVSPKADSEQNNEANNSNEIDVDSDEGSNDSDEDTAKYDLFADLEEPSHVLVHVATYRLAVNSAF